MTRRPRSRRLDNGVWILEIGSDLSIVIVNWNVRELLKRCLHSIISSLQLPTSNFQIEVIVVDNASSDGSVAMIEEGFPQVQLIVNSRRQPGAIHPVAEPGHRDRRRRPDDDGRVHG